MKNLILAVFCTVFSGSAFAIGTQAGTKIENQSTLTYKAGARTDTAQAKATFQVAEVLELNLVAIGNGDIQARSPSQDIVLPYRLTNIGNGTESVRLTAFDQLGDGFQADNLRIYLENQATAGFQITEDVLYTGSNFPQLQPDESIDIYLLVDVSPSLQDGSVSDLFLRADVATADAAGKPVGTLLPKAGDGGVDALVGFSQAQQSQPQRLLVAAVKVDIQKSIVGVDNADGSKRPTNGSVITYQIKINVTGSGRVENLSMKDPLSSNLKYQENSLTLENKTLTDNQGDDEGSYQVDDREVRVELGTVSAPSVHRIKFKVVVI